MHLNGMEPVAEWLADGHLPCGAFLACAGALRACVCVGVMNDSMDVANQITAIQIVDALMSTTSSGFRRFRDFAQQFIRPENCSSGRENQRPVQSQDF